MEHAVQYGGFALEREGGDAAQDESDDKEDEPDADSAEAMRSGGDHCPV